MTSLDIKDAYYSVFVEESVQKYFSLLWNKKLYKFCPRWFTKLPKPPLAKLKEKRPDLLVCIVHIDDICLLGRSEPQWIQNMMHGVKLLRSLSFKTHAEKSGFIPKTKLDILGFTIDSVKIKVIITQLKKKQLIANLCEIKAKVDIKIRKLGKIIWKIVALFPSSMYGPLYYRNSEASKHSGLCKSNG